MKPETAAKQVEAVKLWRGMLERNSRTSANKLIAEARKLKVSYARRQILLRDIRALRETLGLVPRTIDPPPNPHEEWRGGYVSSIIRQIEDAPKVPRVRERYLKRLNALIERYGPEKAYRIMGLDKETGSS